MKKLWKVLRKDYAEPGTTATTAASSSASQRLSNNSTLPSTTLSTGPSSSSGSSLGATVASSASSSFQNPTQSTTLQTSSQTITSSSSTSSPRSSRSFSRISNLSSISSVSPSPTSSQDPYYPISSSTTLSSSTSSHDDLPSLRTTTVKSTHSVPKSSLLVPTSTATKIHHSQASTTRETSSFYSSYSSSELPQSTSETLTTVQSSYQLVLSQTTVSYSQEYIITDSSSTFTTAFPTETVVSYTLSGTNTDIPTLSYSVSASPIVTDYSYYQSVLAQQDSGDSKSVNSSNSKTKQIVGGVVGGFCGALLVLFLLWFCLKRRRRNSGISREANPFSSKMGSASHETGSFLPFFFNSKKSSSLEELNNEKSVPYYGLQSEMTGRNARRVNRATVESSSLNHNVRSVYRDASMTERNLSNESLGSNNSWFGNSMPVLQRRNSASSSLSTLGQRPAMPSRKSSEESLGLGGLSKNLLSQDSSSEYNGPQSPAGIQVDTRAELLPYSGNRNENYYAIPEEGEIVNSNANSPTFPVRQMDVLYEEPSGSEDLNLSSTSSTSSTSPALVQRKSTAGSASGAAAKNKRSYYKQSSRYNHIGLTPIPVEELSSLGRTPPPVPKPRKTFNNSRVSSGVNSDIYDTMNVHATHQLNSSSSAPIPDDSSLLDADSIDSSLLTLSSLDDIDDLSSTGGSGSTI